MQYPNFTKMRQYGDLDALIEIYGHLRAENPTLDVFHRLTSDVVAARLFQPCDPSGRDWLE